MADNALSLGKTPLRTIFRLSWPTILEQLLISMISYVDSAMVGAMGAAATASIAVVSSSLWLIGGFMSATGVGFTYLVAHSVGAGDRETCTASVQQAALCVLGLGLLLTLVVESVSAYLPHWLGADPEVIPQSVRYLRIVGGALTFQCAMAVFSAVTRGAGDTRTPMLVNLGANLLNVVGNFLLIYPARTVTLLGREVFLWGAGLGVTGAAIATVTAQVLAGLILFLSLFYTRMPIRISSLTLRPRPDLLRKAFKVGFPTALERSFLSLGQIAMTAIVTALGTASLAAHHLAITAEGIAYLPAWGFSTTNTTLVGQSLGARDRERARTFSRLTCRVGCLFLLAGSAALFLLAEPLMRLLTVDEEVIRLGRDVLRIVSFAEPFYGIYLMLSGVFYGAGDSRFPFVVSSVGMWGIRIGLSWLLARPLGMGIQGAWIGMAVDLIARGIACVIHYYREKWLNLPPIK